MGSTTSISWTDSTWNPWVGCHKVSEGCRNCYMFRDQARRGIDPTIVRPTSNATFNGPLNSRKWPAGHKVFTCSYSDFFIEQADGWRSEAWSIIRQRPDLIFQILTKRPGRIPLCLPSDWGDGWPNVWLGVTIEDWSVAWRFDELIEIPAQIRWISYEPAIGPLLLPNDRWEYLDWLVMGGESGPSARVADLRWLTDSETMARSCGVPVFFKQVGGNKKIDGIWGGDWIEIDGELKQFHNFPKS